MRTRLVLVALVAFLAALFVAGTADAKKKKKKKAKTTASQKNTPKANKEAMAALMGAFKWDMTEDEVIAVLETQVNGNYQEKVDGASDMMEKKRLRGLAKDEVKRIKESHTDFDGKHTGWDVSIIEREFGIKNSESMVVYNELDAATGKTQDRYFFFWNGKLWKMFIAFNMDAYENKDFAYFSDVMEKVYGQGVTQMRYDAAGKEHFDYLYWRGGGYYLRAIDLTSFYGNFCVAISDDPTEKSIATARAEASPANVEKANAGTKKKASVSAP